MIHTARMAALPLRHWLVLPDAARFAITAGGVVIGRSSRCDVVIDHPQASRQHAIVVEQDQGPRVMALGRGRIEVNGAAIEHERALVDGDQLAVPGLTARISVGASGVHIRPAWTLRTRGGARFGLTRPTFVIGGSADADLRIASLPPEAVRLEVGAELVVVARVPVIIDGLTVAPGQPRVLATATWIEVGDDGFHVDPSAGSTDAATAAELQVPTLPTLVAIEFLPRGGRLHVTIAGHAVTVFLSEKRCDLVAALLRPPLPLVAGEFISDDVLLPRLWPGRTMTRVDLNTLVHRTRQDLAPLGLDPAELIARAPGGGATRFGLAPGAVVRFE